MRQIRDRNDLTGDETLSQHDEKDMLHRLRISNASFSSPRREETGWMLEIVEESTRGVAGIRVAHGHCGVAASMTKVTRGEFRLLDVTLSDEPQRIETTYCYSAYDFLLRVHTRDSIHDLHESTSNLCNHESNVKRPCRKTMSVHGIKKPPSVC